MNKRMRTKCRYLVSIHNKYEVSNCDKDVYNNHILIVHDEIFNTITNMDKSSYANYTKLFRDLNMAMSLKYANKLNTMYHYDEDIL